MPRLRSSIALVAVIAAAACGGGDLVLPNEGQANRISAVAGDAQTAPIQEPAAESLVVRVVDRFGNPAPGVEITWTAPGGGGVSPTTVVTDADGRAAAQRVLGLEVGTYLTTAIATPLPDHPVSFTTTAVAAKLAIETQPGAIAESGAPIDPQPVLRLQDPAGAPLPRAGVTVIVQIAAGDGTLRGTTSRQSDGDGRVTFTDLAIAGAPGSRTLIFAADGYASAVSTPVSLGVGPPATVAVAQGAGQTAPAGTSVPIRPAVIVRDAGGTAVANVPVTFAVASGGGSVSGGSTSTGADGTARVGAWTLGGQLGTNTLTATVGADGVSGNPVTFTATGVTGTPSGEQSSVTAAPGSIVASAGGSSSTITVVVRDDRGNPVPGVAVTLTAGGSGVTLQQPGVTDPAGAATGRFSATAAGPHPVSAAAGDTPLGSTEVTVTAAAPSAARSGAQVPAGAAGLATVVAMTLQDEFGNPVAGAAGQIGVVVTGANPGAAVAIEDAGGGGYRARYTPTTVGVDQIDVRVAGLPVPGSPFASTVSPGPSDPGQTVASVPDGVFATPLEIGVQVRDPAGNPVGHGGDAVQITPEGTSSLTVVDNADGTYRAVWVPFRLGQVSVTITLNGTPIAGSPFVANIRFFR